MPLGTRHDARLDEVHAREVGGDLIVGPPVTPAERLVQDGLQLGGVWIAQGPEVRHEQAAAFRDRVLEGRDDAERVLVVGQVVQDGAGDDGDRPAEVQQCPQFRVAQHGTRVRDVRADHDRLVVFLQQRPAMREDNGVNVDIADPGAGIDALRDLMHVVRRGQAGPEVEELVDAKLIGDVRDSPDQAGPVVLRDGDRAGEARDEDLADLPVGGEVVLATEQVVVHTSDAGYFRVERRRIHRSLPLLGGLPLARLHVPASIPEKPGNWGKPYAAMPSREAELINTEIARRDRAWVRYLATQPSYVPSARVVPAVWHDRRS